ncbi:oxidoreductase [Clostridia bacterium]|nr:oxidoreductase [Clostridia bacterium]
MKTKITWGVMGAAKIADKFCEAVGNNGGAVGFIASADKLRAQAFAETHGVRRFGGYEELLADGEVNAVYICGTNDVHCEHVLRALDAGKHVLVEKPAAVTAAQWRQMSAFARQKGLFLMEAMWSLFLPYAAAVRDSLKKIGPIRTLECDFCTSLSKISHSGVSRVYALKNYGGGLLDLGVYTVHFLNFVMNGAPDSVTAAGRLNDEKTDSLVAAVLRYGDTVAVTRTAIDCAEPRGIGIYGESGQIAASAFPAPFQITVKTAEHEETIDASFSGNGFEYEIRHTEECIAKGLSESPLLTHAATLNALLVLERAMEQIGYGKG